VGGEGQRSGGGFSVPQRKCKKIAKVHTISSCFGHEDLVFNKFVKRTLAKLPITIENFKISQ
jgi:hypothetical protein